MNELEIDILKEKSRDELIEIIERTYSALKFIPGLDINSMKELLVFCN